MIAVVTNIDREHMDFHQTMERLNESFLAFINKIPFYGLAVLCIDDANVHGLLSKTRKRFATYGLSAEADFSAQDLKMSLGGVEFTVVHHGKPLGNLRLHLPGRHSATNALAAVVVAHELEIPFARAGSYREELHGIDNFAAGANETRWVMVPGNYGRIWTVG